MSVTSPKKKKKVKKKSHLGLYLILILLCVIGFIGYKVFGPNTGKLKNGTYLYIHTNTDYKQLLKTLEEGEYINDMYIFDLIAQQVKLPQHIHAGKYQLRKGMSNYDIIRLLRSGKQTPVKLVINKLRTKKELINLLSSNLEADSLSLNQLFNDKVYLAQFGLDTNTLMCAIFPDTYQFYWNTSADKSFRKIENNFSHYWDKERKMKAKELGFTPIEITIIASIVDEETNKNEDKPNIASVYINRIKKGMKLQADPTVKFALNDFAIRRITGEMLQTTSLYNTYKYEGLPPGPICTPSLNSIESVLSSPKTTYLYFCAKSDFSGYSAFATTFDEQLKNARAYQKALDQKGIH